MAHTIEEAKSGRASCRTCKQTIAKGDLRVGEEVVNAFSDSGSMAYQWHHIACAAKKKPLVLEAALKDTTLTIPNREALEAEIAANKKNQKPGKFPYAERAKTSRSTCLSCSESIEKGTLRVAVEREVEVGAGTMSSAGYLHAACSADWIPENTDFEGDLIKAIVDNSTSLEPADVAALKMELDS